jgi:DNA polymerase elongation subunit (family B)
MKAYKHVYYDRWNKEICVKFVGDKNFTRIAYQKDYWVKDPSGKSEWTDLHGVPMIRKKLQDKEVIKTLKQNGFPIAESDLKEEVKWMHDTYDKETLEVNIKDWNIGVFDIEIAVENSFPKPEEAAYPINLITFYSTETDTTYTWGLFEPGKVKDDDIVKNYRNFTDELEMLKDWLHWFNNQSFDVITGWNSVLFDIPYIINRIKRIRGERGIKAEYENLLSPIGKRPEGKDISDKKIGNALGSSYDIPGMVHLDSMELYKTFASHGPLSSFSLNSIAMNELGEGKLEYEGTINTIWQTDPQQFTRYNVVDVIRNKQIILDKCKLFSLVIEYAYDCLVTLDKVYNKVPTTEGYFLRYMHNEQKKVMNDRPDHHDDWWRNEECFKVKKPDGTIYYQNCEWEKGTFDFDEFHVKAGYCYDDPGRYDDCMSFDITSSYPHHIMQFNISPEVKVIRPTKEQVESGEVILSDVNDVGFKRTDDAILPSIVKKVFDERKHFKDLMKKAKKIGDKDLAALYDNRQGVKKIIINSMYGVCLAPGFHMYDIDCARAITRCARVTLRDWLKKYLDKYYISEKMIQDVEKYFEIKLNNKTPLKIKNRECVCVHADTDSLYFCINELKERLKSEGIKIETEDEHRKFYSTAEQMFQDFFVKVLERRAAASKTTNRIKYNRENIFSNMFCFAKKLYIGNVIDSEGTIYPFNKPKHKIMGVGIKRSDMPEFCKDAAEKLAFDICSGQDYEKSRQFILDTYEKFCNASPDELAASKSVSEYTKYVTKSIDYYVKNGLHFDKGQVFNAKCALAYNYIISKFKLPYTPIMNGNKFHYLYVKSDKFTQIEAIAFVGNWPKEFSKWFTVDHETMFKKTFIPLFESMFKVAKWIGEKDTISLETAGLEAFF